MSFIKRADVMFVLFAISATSSEKIETEQQKTVGNRRLRKLTIIASKQNNGDEY